MIGLLKYWRIAVFVGALAGGGWAGYKIAQSGCLNDKLNAAEDYAAALEEAMTIQDARYQKALDDYAVEVTALMAQAAMDAQALVERERQLQEARERFNEIRETIVVAELGFCTVTPEFTGLWRRIVGEANNSGLPSDPGDSGAVEAADGG